MQESKVISNHVLIANKTKGEIKKLPWIYTTKETQTSANNKYTGKLQDKILCTTNFITRVIYCITMKLQINLILKVCSPQSWWRISVTGILLHSTKANLQRSKNRWRKFRFHELSDLFLFYNVERIVFPDHLLDMKHFHSHFQDLWPIQNFTEISFIPCLYSYC